MNIKIIIITVLFSFLSINGLAQAGDGHVLPESDYPYWPEYNHLEFENIKDIVPHPWVVDKNAEPVLGWDWSMPESLEPADDGLVGMDRISNLHLTQPKFLFEESHAKFPINSVGALWVSWRNLEPVEGTINFEPLKAKILDAKSKNIDVILRIHTSSYSRGGNVDNGDAPLWMEKYVDQSDSGGMSQNYDPSDPEFHKRYLKFVEALGDKLSLQIDDDTLDELRKGNDSYQQLPIDAEPQSIADLVKAAYVGYASKTVGDEGIGPHGEDEWELNDAEVHVQERLAAWKKAFNGQENKVFMGGQSKIGDNYGFGTRRGFVEMYLGNIPNRANKPNSFGQAITNEGYIYIDEDVSIIKKGAFHGEENEEYEEKYAQASDYRFGRTTNSFSYRYFISTLRAIQMRCTYVLSSAHLVPEMLPFLAQQLGRTAQTSADVWTFLNTSYLKKGRNGQEVRNLERWLYQRDAPGYTTEAAKRMQHAIVMSSVFVGKHHDDIARTGSKIGFHIDDNWHGNGKPLVVKVSYFDEGNGTLNLVYNNQNISQSQLLEDSGELKTVTFIVDDLQANSMDHGFDFTLESGSDATDITVSMVRAVIRLDENTAAINITSSSIVDNSVTIVAGTDSDSDPIEHVSFYVDDQWHKDVSSDSDSYSYTFDNLSDGEHTFVVRSVATDGTETWSESLTLSLGEPPELSISIGLASVYGNEVTVEAVSDNNTINFVGFYVDGIWSKNISSDSDTYTHTFTGVSDGDRVFTVKAVADSTTSWSDPVTVSVGEISVKPIITSSVDGNSVTISATSTSEQITRIGFYIDGNFGKNISSGPYSYTFNDLSAGTYLFTAYLVEGDGTKTMSDPTEITIAGPIVQPPTITSSVTGNSVTITAESESTSIGFYLDGVLTTNVSSAPYSYTFTNLSPGTYEFTAENDGAMSDPITIIIERPIVKPTIFSSFDADSVAIIAAADSDQVTHFGFYLNGVPVVNVSSPPYSHTFTGLSAGNYAFTVSLVEDDGRVTMSDAIEITIPDLIVTKPTITYSLDGDSVTITAESESDQITHIGFYVDGQWVKNLGLAPYTWTFSGLSYGEHDFQIMLLEDDGTQIWSESLTLTIQNTPEPSSVSIASSSIVGDSVTINADTSSENVTLIGFYVDGQWVKNIGSAPYTYTYTGLSDGEHDFQIMLLEDDGTQIWSESLTLTIQNTPEPSSVSIASSSIVGDSVTINADTSSENVTLIGFYVDGQWVKNIGSAPYTYTFTGLSEGDHDFQIKLVKDDGTKTLSEPLTLTIEPTLPILPVWIASSSIVGDSVTINADSTSNTITLIGFYVDGQWVKNLGSAPYTWTFTGLSNGDHDFQIKLIENDGSQTWSEPETLTID